MNLAIVSVLSLVAFAFLAYVVMLVIKKLK